MQYMGGKSRISKQISEVINEIPRWKIKNSEANSTDYNKYNREGGGGILYSLVCFAVLAQ